MPSLYLLYYKGGIHIPRHLGQLQEEQAAVKRVRLSSTWILAASMWWGVAGGAGVKWQQLTARLELCHGQQIWRQSQEQRGFFPTSSSSGSSRHQAVSPAFLPGLVSVNYVGACSETRFGCVYSKGANAYDIRACGLVKGAESSPISKQACCWQQWDWICGTGSSGNGSVTPT